MKRLVILLLVNVTMHAFSQRSADSTAIINLLISDYKTLQNFDIQKHISNCTKDYRLVEDGEIWDLKKEIEYFKSNAGRSLTRKDNFSIQKVTVSGNMAFAIYILRTEIREKNQLSSKAWTETAAFQKVSGSWKIALIHSTTISGK